MSPDGAAWTDLGDGVVVRQSRAWSMNSVLLLDPEHTVIVDPGVLPSELDDLARVVGAIDPEQLTLYFTHAHWDHVLGRSWWSTAQTLAHDRCAEEMRREAAAIAREAEATAAAHGESWSAGFSAFRPDVTVSGQRYLAIGPWRIVFRDAPGHCPNQLSCHLTDLRILLAADMLSDLEPPILDGPPAIYRATLGGLLPLAEHGAIETLVPGHGAVARGREAVMARFQGDLDYLTALEAGVEQARANGSSLEAARESLAGMEYPGRRSSVHPTENAHFANIAFTYRALETARSRER